MARDEHGMLKAMHALYEGDLTRARELLPADDELDVAEAAAFGRLDRLRTLLERSPEAANERSRDGFTPLHLAIFGGSLEAVRLLIAHGADVDAVSEHPTIRVRPLGTAAFGRSTEAARLLLDAGADVNGRGEGSFTALHSAAASGDQDLVRLLLEHGADATLADLQGRRPADLAETAGATDVADVLRAAPA
jgi:ankyrin repeat protein